MLYSDIRRKYPGQAICLGTEGEGRSAWPGLERGENEERLLMGVDFLLGVMKMLQS